MNKFKEGDFVLYDNEASTISEVFEPGHKPEATIIRYDDIQKGPSHVQNILATLGAPEHLYSLSHIEFKEVGGARLTKLKIKKNIDIERLLLAYMMEYSEYFDWEEWFEKDDTTGEI